MVRFYRMFSTVVLCGQCYQIGRFLKDLATIIFTKVALIFDNFCVYFKKRHLKLLHWQLLGEIGQLFILKSGHPACGHYHAAFFLKFVQKIMREEAMSYDSNLR